MLQIQRNHSLKDHNTFGIDATTSAWVQYDDVSQLQEVARMLHSGELPSPWMHVGGGSNLLFARDWEGTILHSAITGIEVLQQQGSTVRIRVGAGVEWDMVVATCVERGWYGVENLSDVPGETGAAVVQNIGAYGVEVADVVEQVEVFDMQTGQIRSFRKEECGYGYRMSIFKRPDHKRYVVLSAVFRLSVEPVFTLTYKALTDFLQKQSPLGDATLAGIRNAVRSIRASKLPDPAKIGNAGSFFKNPVVGREKLQELLALWPAMPYHPVTAEESGSAKLAAGWLIEQCGWKGRSVGRAAVYEKQALVLINTGGATGEEILALSRAIVESVQEKFGVLLEPEVNSVL